MSGFLIFFSIIALLVKRKSIFGVIFLVSFFTFLCGRLVVNWIGGSSSLIEGGFVNGTPTDEEIVPMLNLFLLSLLFFEIGISLTKKNIAQKMERNNSADGISNVFSYTSFLIFYITMVIKIFVSIERAAYLLLLNNNYTDYYLNYISILPSVVLKIAEFNTPAFFCILAMGDDAKKTRKAIIVYLLNDFLILLSGQRHQFVVATLLCVGYLLLKRNKENSKEWIKDSEIKLMLMCIPIGIILLQIWGIIRDGVAFELNGFGNEIKNFFVDQGSTSALIYNGIELNDSMPRGVYYSFSSITNFFRDNVFTNLIMGSRTLVQHTAEYALSGNNYGATLTYLHIPSHYLAGIGMGTSYIAEVFHDFGYLGIVVINVLYGVILCNLEDSFETAESVWKRMIMLMLAYGIIYAPRDSALSFITMGINFVVIGYFLLHTFICNIKNKH